MNKFYITCNSTHYSVPAEQTQKRKITSYISNLWGTVYLVIFGMLCSRWSLLPSTFIWSPLVFSSKCQCRGYFRKLENSVPNLRKKREDALFLQALVFKLKVSPCWYNKKTLETLHIPTPSALLHIFLPPKRFPTPLDSRVLRLDHRSHCGVRPVKLSVVHVWHIKLISVSSLSMVVCELPLLEGIAGFTWVEAKRVTLRPRLQAHVVGNKLCYEVLRLHKRHNRKHG